MKESLIKILEEAKTEAGDDSEKLADYLMRKSIYAPKLKFGDQVFGIKVEGLKKSKFKGVVCGITYSLTVKDKELPETWYVVKLEGQDQVEIVSEEEIFLAEDKEGKNCGE